jgi:hypothetical protein
MIAIQPVYWCVCLIYRQHSFLCCEVLDSVHRVVAWQRNDQVRYNVVTYLGFVWLVGRVLNFMIEFIGPLYNLLQQLTNHYLTHCNLLPTGHSTGTILTSNLNRLYSFNSDLIYDWLCPLITHRHGRHRKYRVMLSRIHVYWSVT